MAPNFDLWPQQWQNGPHTAERSYSTPGEFYTNIHLETKPSKASHKCFCTADKLVQEQEEEQKV